MARIVALRAHLERITDEFVHGVLAVIGEELEARREREVAARPPLRAVDGAASASSSSKVRKAPAPRKSAPAAAPPSRPTRASDAAPRAEAPNAVTDPELLLAALEQRSDAPASGTRERTRAPSKSNGAKSLLGSSTPTPPSPPPPVAGPALRSDEISVTTPGGGVVIKRVRRQSEAV